MTTSSTNKSFQKVMAELEQIKMDMELEELDFEDDSFEEQEDFSNEEEVDTYYFNEPDEAQEWYDFDPDC